MSSPSIASAEQFAGGVWPTMLTPFDEDGAVDYSCLEALVDWYLQRGVSGIFAVCQSSEMFSLSLSERVEISRAVRKRVGGRCGVIASGHVSVEVEAQIEELNAIGKTGVDAVVLVSNRLADETQSDDVWMKNADTLLDGLPKTLPLGLYECPHPYKRLLSDKLLRWILKTGRFRFLKDTSCERNIQRRRAELAAGSSLHLYNANAATLLDSITFGYVGYSGVMANFHPQLYASLCKLSRRNCGIGRKAEAGGGVDGKEKTELLQAFLGISSLIEEHGYPLNAKHYLADEGLPILPIVRMGKRYLHDVWLAELEQLRRLSQSFAGDNYDT